MGACHATDTLGQPSIVRAFLRLTQAPLSLAGVLLQTNALEFLMNLAPAGLTYWLY
jgi:hypothetical protein